MADAPPAGAAPLPGWRYLFSGKVRDVYSAAGDDDVLLLVASDRVSAFDHVLGTPVPGKGAVLTRLSRWWFERLADVVPHHLVPADAPGIPPVPAGVADRALVARRLAMIEVECVARGHIAGSGWREYERSGRVAGIELPAGLREGDRLPEPLFTPATKAPQGSHDENITFDELVDRVGGELAERLRETTIQLYRRGAEIAGRAGFLLADTKVEFGMVPRDATERAEVVPIAGPGLVLGDEVMTPDSSRYWLAEQWRPGEPPPQYDKQIIRDWLAGPDSGWDPAGADPPPPLPDVVLQDAARRYQEVAERLMRER